MKKKVIIKLILFALLLMLIAILIILFNNKKIQQESQNFTTETEEELDNTILEPVKSAVSYFTVQNCINKYLGYVAQNNAEAIYSVLDKGYIEKNNITTSNVLEIIKRYENSIAYSARQIYLEQTNQDIDKYYAIGTITSYYAGDEEFENEEILDENACFEVNLNYDNMTFSITPIDDGRDY